MRVLKLCCDTNTLREHIAKHADEKSKKELAALDRLVQLQKDGKVQLWRSNILEREVARNPDASQRDGLIRDQDRLARVAKNETLIGIKTQDDVARDFTSSPMFSDAYDPAICAQLRGQGLKRGDPEHITQAICNGCDVFLTRDKKTIKPRHRLWLEKQFGLKVMSPSELLAFVETAPARSA